MKTVGLRFLIQEKNSRLDQHLKPDLQEGYSENQIFISIFFNILIIYCCIAVDGMWDYMFVVSLHIFN